MRGSIHFRHKSIIVFVSMILLASCSFPAKDSSEKNTNIPTVTNTPERAGSIQVDIITDASLSGSSSATATASLIPSP